MAFSFTACPSVACIPFQPLSPRPNQLIRPCTARALISSQPRPKWDQWHLVLLFFCWYIFLRWALRSASTLHTSTRAHREFVSEITSVMLVNDSVIFVQHYCVQVQTRFPLEQRRHHSEKSEAEAVNNKVRPGQRGVAVSPGRPSQV